MKKLQKKTVIKLVILLLFIIAVVWIYYGNTHIQITRGSVHSPRIPKTFEDFTIVQISDLHNARFGKNQKRLIQAIKEAEPDIIVVTGDLIDSNRTNVEIAMEFISQAVEIAPVYYVTGNHETWALDDYRTLEEQMREAGVHVLEDETVTLEQNGEYVQLIGLSDIELIKEAAAQEGNIAEKKLEKLMSTNIYTILLSHRPELFESYCRAHANLVFSGHAHGGQFRIPFIGGLIAPNQGFLPEYSEGYFTEDDTTMFVSRGLGNSVIPFRINNLPEIVVVTLHSGEGGK